MGFFKKLKKERQTQIITKEDLGLRSHRTLKKSTPIDANVESKANSTQKDRRNTMADHKTRRTPA